MSGQPYNPLTLLTVLGLLSAGDVKKVDSTLQFLNFAVDTTAKSVASIQQGLQALDAGLKQLNQPATTGSSSETQESAAEKVEWGTDPNFTVLPQDAPGQEEKEQQDVSEEENGISQ